MYNFNTLFQSLVRSLESLLKKIIPSDNKTQYKFFFDMTFGILKSNSIILNDIAHSLNESITLKKTNERLYKNLLKEIEELTTHSFISYALSYTDKNNLIFLVDDSDVIKPYGEKFESLGVVRDGSSKTNKYEKGYLLTQIVCLSKGYKHPIPIITKVYSSNEKDFLSTNNITNQAILKVVTHLKPFEATFVFDRGYDNSKLINLIININHYFIIRIAKNRVIYMKNRKSKVFDEAKRRKGKIVIPITYKGFKSNIKVSHIEGKINGVKDNLTIVFSYLDNNPEPMVLVTNKKVKSKENLIKISLNYISRWKIEELFRFKKVEFGLESFRVKSLTSINNLNFILDISILFLIKLIENQNKNMLFNECINNSKAIRDDVYILFYRLLSGLKTIFTSNIKGVKNYQQIERWETKEHNLFSKEFSNKIRVRKK